MIYKICDEQLWRAAEASGVFGGAAIDLQDGFIHFSKASQAKETAEKHFRGQKDLLLVAVDENRLGDALKWEKSRGGALFPHLYGDLPMNLVESVVQLPLADDGSFEWPELQD